jgi:probable rRNA maturation factor
MPPVLSLSKTARPAWAMPLAACELEAVFEAMLVAAGISGVGAELALLDDASMESLHAESLGCAGPTTILAFPEHALAANLPGATRALGHLALSLDTLERECFLYGQEPLEHCIRLLAHGLAHLLGHEHGPAMNALADRMGSAALTLCRTP